MKDVIYITVILIQLALALFAINTQKIKITQLEQDLNVSRTQLTIATSPYFIQHSKHCLDSMLF